MQSSSAHLSDSAHPHTALPKRGEHYRPVEVLKNIGIAILLVLVFAGLSFTAYVRDYYHADASAMALVASASSDAASSSVTIMETHNRQIVFAPEEPAAGLIFYPGGKVQYEAYAPLMESLAERGILCVLLHMPCNLAVLDIQAADGIAEQYPTVHKWYIAGHSLGGAMAASYAADHTDTLDGLILLAAYSTEDLTRSGLQTLCIYGTEDRVMSRESYEAYRTNLPASNTEVILDGGCHAFFGCYGAQTGDGTPAISNEEQIRQTTEAICRLVGV